MTMTEHEIDDPFALPDYSKIKDRDAIITGGRYRLPHRDGSHKKRGWQRVSNLVSAYSDQFGLRMWELGEVLQGVAMSPELYATLLQAGLQRMDKAERKAWVEQFIEQAKDVSGGNVGSRHGSQRHAAVETLHAGLPTQHLGPATRRDLVLYQAALDRNGLVPLAGMQERRVLVEELEAVGTLDNVVEDQRALGLDLAMRPEADGPTAFGPLYVADLKTQKRFWTWLEIKAQLACYAHGVAMWDAAAGRWVDMPPVSQEVAIVLAMGREPEDPVERAAWEPHVDVWEVDIVEGWATARRAYEVVRDRAKAKSVKPGAWLRPAPSVTELERWASRFAAVETLAEGRALVVQAKDAGVWSAELAQSAALAAERLRVPA